MGWWVDWSVGRVAVCLLSRLVDWLIYLFDGLKLGTLGEYFDLQGSSSDEKDQRDKLYIQSKHYTKSTSNAFPDKRSSWQKLKMRWNAMTNEERWKRTSVLSESKSIPKEPQTVWLGVTVNREVSFYNNKRLAVRKIPLQSEVIRRARPNCHNAYYI